MPTHIVDVRAHALKEGANVVDAVGNDNLAIVEPQADPQVVHEHGEERHHGSDADGSAEFIPVRMREDQRVPRQGFGIFTHSSCASSFLSFSLPFSVMLMPGT